MVTYKQFLEKAGVISEEQFNEIINSVPEFDIDFTYFDAADDENQICDSIINSVLNDWDSAYGEAFDFNDKTFDLYDVESLKDLEEIKKAFNQWTISNYNELKEEIIEEEKENKNLIKMDKLIQEIRNKCKDVNKLEKFVNSL